MPRPNFPRIERQQAEIAQWVGETATWRHYIGIRTGTPSVGIGDEPMYGETTITGLFAPVLPEEINAAGGQYVIGDVRMTPIGSVQLGTADKVVWRGASHHVVTDPLPQAVVAGAQRVLLRRGGTL